MKKDTLVTAAGRHPEGNFGVVNPPVYHASTITFETLEEFQTRDRPNAGKIPQYGRSGTPTQFAFEEAITAMHGGYDTIAYPSGLAALAAAAMAFLKNGDHMLMADTVYGPSRSRLAGTLMARAGIETSFFDPAVGTDIDSLIQPETRVIFMESPGSLTFEMMDIVHRDASIQLQNSFSVQKYHLLSILRN